MSLLNKLTQVAKSKQGQELLGKAKTFANDPKTRAKIDEAREKITDQVNTAKEKLAEKKAKEEAERNGATAAAGSAPVADAPAAGSAPVADAPAPADEAPAPPADPAYGDDGPKAA